MGFFDRLKYLLCILGDRFPFYLCVFIFVSDDNIARIDDPVWLRQLGSYPFVVTRKFSFADVGDFVDYVLACVFLCWVFFFCF
jgi:hypothetical protein